MAGEARDLLQDGFSLDLDDGGEELEVDMEGVSIPGLTLAWEAVRNLLVLLREQDNELPPIVA